MREYGQIQSSYWGDADIQQLSDFGKLLGAYLLTSPHSNGIGCFRLPLGYVSEDFGKGIETVKKGFAELFEIGFLWRCERTNFVLIRNFLRWNPIANPNVAKSRQKEFDVIPKKFSYFKELSEELLKHGAHFEERYVNRFETLSKQDPTQPNPEPSMSGKPDDGPLPEAEAIEYLNQRTGKNFELVESNLRLVRGRMKEGRTLDELKAVVDFKISDWESNPDMQKFLRPATLFNAEKFNQYFGELGSQQPERFDGYANA